MRSRSARVAALLAATAIVAAACGGGASPSPSASEPGGASAPPAGSVEPTQIPVETVEATQSTHRPVRSSIDVRSSPSGSMVGPTTTSILPRCSLLSTPSTRSVPRTATATSGTLARVASQAAPRRNPASPKRSTLIPSGKRPRTPPPARWDSDSRTVPNGTVPRRTGITSNEPRAQSTDR